MAKVQRTGGVRAVSLACLLAVSTVVLGSSQTSADAESATCSDRPACGKDQVLLQVPGSAIIAGVSRGPTLDAQEEDDRGAGVYEGQEDERGEELEADEAPGDEEPEGPEADAARASLLEAGRVEAAAAAKAALQRHVQDIVGPKGVVVTYREGLPAACAEGTFLQEAIVHADGHTRSLICQPCHAACGGGCFGAQRGHCVEDGTGLPGGHEAGSAPARALVDRLHEDMMATLQGAPAGGVAAGGAKLNGFPGLFSALAVGHRAGNVSAQQAVGMIHSSVDPGLCLQLADAIYHSSRSINAWPCAGEVPEQHFVMPVGFAGEIRLAAHPEFCLDVNAGIAEPGNNIQIWACKLGHPNMQFELSGNGTGKIHWAAHPDLCVDVADGQGNGANVQLSACSDSQEFFLEASQVGLASPIEVTSTNLSNASVLNATGGGAAEVTELVNRGIGGADPEDLPDLSACLGSGTCTVESVAHGDVEGKAVGNFSSELIAAGSKESINASVSQLRGLPAQEQEAINTELARCGFIPGMTREPSSGSSDEEAPPADDLLWDMDADNTSAAGDPSALALATRGQRRAGLSAAKAHMISMLGKNYDDVPGKRKRKDFARKALGQLLGDPNDECLEAVDALVGAQQELYGCWKPSYEPLKKAFCGPVDQHEQLRGIITTLYDATRVLHTGASLLQVFPYVGPVARAVAKVTKAVKNVLPHHINRIEDLRVQRKNMRDPDGDCCPPFAERQQKCKWEASYKCGACSSGAVCKASRACETIKKLEGKMDIFKFGAFDELVEQFTDFAEKTSPQEDTAAGTFLAGCGVSTCGQVKRAAEHIQKQVREVFWDRVCPLPQIDVPKLELGLLETGKRFLNAIASAIGKVTSLLDVKTCVSYPRSTCWTETECARVYLPCCSHGRRRRWSGFRCGSCCHNVCVPVPKCRFWMEKVCFSGRDIINGLHGLMYSLFKPIMEAIEKGINAVLKPVLDLVDKVVDKVLSPLHVLCSLEFDLDVLQIDVPELPSPPTCEFVQNAANQR